ncbi:ANTAR domain-containing protein [Streptomyces sp. NPDC088387]|uniref:ANTAR domain-containing protein n=1 Tax=Streptomyces sp. NPDC088387 TaxID=3365859 RepID=UPI0038159066
MANDELSPAPLPPADDSSTASTASTASSVDAAAEESLRVENRELQERVAGLETQIRARSQVALAQGVLMGRYRLDDPADAFALMRNVSQRFNVKLHQIAAVLTATPAPAPDAAEWFPYRARTAAPSLKALRAGPLDAKNQGQVLGAALRRVLEVAGADAGNAQLSEGGALRMEKHQGHPRAFTDYFAFVEGGTSCSRAAEAVRQVTVRDIATAEVFDSETRQVILDSGSRGCHSVPLVDPDGGVRGVISSHHTHPVTGFTRTQLAAFDQVQRTTGEWLQWYAGTVVLDALEQLHRTARDES